MPSYILQDIGVNTSGDISISPNGDIELATSYETVKNTVNFLIKTDKGQYRPNQKLGCDLGSFIGAQSTAETFNSIEQFVYSNLTKFIIDPRDLQVHAVPLDQNNAGLFLVIGGSYFSSDGNPLTDDRPEVITYTYPFTDGQPTLINIA